MMSIVKALIPREFSLGVVTSPFLHPSRNEDWVIIFPIMGQEGWEGDITKEGRSIPLTKSPWQIRHFERLVNITTFKSYNKIYAYKIDIGREKIQT